MKVSAIYNRVRNNKLFTDSAWSISGSVIGYGLSLISGIILARFMGDTVYGEFGMVKQMLIYMCIVATFGMGITGTRFIAKASSENEVCSSMIAAFSISTAFSLCLAIPLYVFSNPLAQFLGSERFSIPLKITSFALIFCASYTTGTGLLSGQKKFKEITVIKIIYGLAMLLGCVSLYYFWGLNGAVWGLTLCYFIVTLVCLYVISRKRGIKCYNRHEVISIGGKMISFSLPVVLHEAIYGLMNWLLMLVIAKMSDYSQLGLYNAAAIWGSTIMFIPTAMRSVALAHLSSSQANKDSHHEILKRLIIITAISVIAPMLLVILFSGFIQTLYGSSFEGLSNVISVTCLSCIFNAAIFILTQELTSEGNNWPIFISRFIGNCFALLITILLIKYFNQKGAISAAWACLFSAIIMSTILAVYISAKKRKH